MALVIKCDKCNKEINTKKAYYKISKHEEFYPPRGKAVPLEIGDFCEECMLTFLDKNILKIPEPMDDKFLEM